MIRASLAKVSLPSTRNLPWGSLVGVLAGVVVIYLLLVPLGMLFFSSFRATKGVLPFEATSWTFNNYIEVFTSGVTYRLFSVTIQYTIVALVIGLGLALVFAWFIERTNAPARGLLVVLVLTPLGVPPIVEAMAAILIANPVNGILNVWLRDLLGLTAATGPLNIYSIVGMGIVSGIKMVPSAYILTASVMARMDPVLEEASLASGASQLTTFRRITTTLMRPALLAVVILFGVHLIEAFEIPALLGMPKGLYVFSTLIYQAVHPLYGLPDYGLASSYAVLSLAIGVGMIYLYHRNVRRQEKFAVITGKGYRPKPVALRRLWKAIFVGTIVVYVALSTILPFLVLLWASLGILYKPTSLAAAHLGYYIRIAHYPGIMQAIWNTLIVSVGSATITMVLALIISWLAIRSGIRGGSLPDRMTITATAIPSIVIALALIFFYIHFPFPIYGTIWIIMIAHITRYMAYASRVINASYLQIHRELEEASSASGGSWLSTIIHIVLPLLWPAFSRGWLWVFIHAMRDVTLALMLYTVHNGMIGVMLWNIWREESFELGAAIAVPLMLVSTGLSILITRPAMVHKEVSG